MWQRFLDQWKYNWTIGRGILLGVGLAGVGSVFFEFDGLTLVFGLVLLVQAYLNTPCLLGMGACRVDLEAKHRAALKNSKEGDKSHASV
jgi:hypothetical protein